MAGMSLMKPYQRAHNFSMMRASIDALGIHISIKVDPNFNQEFRLHRDWRRKLSNSTATPPRSDPNQRSDQRPAASRSVR